MQVCWEYEGLGHSGGPLQSFGQDSASMKAFRSCSRFTAESFRCIPDMVSLDFEKGSTCASLSILQMHPGSDGAAVVSK